MGRVDLHNHLLFGLDDGARDVEESLQLARMLVDAGFTDVATTPHHREDYAPSSATVRERRSEVQARLDQEGIALRLHPGREHHLTPELLERVSSGEAELLGTGRYLLLELPFQTPVPSLSRVLFHLRVHGVQPLIAHPERCAHFQSRPDAAREVVEAGAHLQLEIGSLAGVYGAPARRCARQWLDEDLVSVVASDVHHPRSAQEILGRGIEVLEKELGVNRTALLLSTNPAKVLAGESLARPNGVASE